uniref:Uncharacterized protein n=1 Tax=Podospora anserina (strain S / ATCC MYA-4624 / DSM 980 / FGSC 10383) TaxID=515849 RepID=A0A090D719_PODAN|nr:Putative protein of unknown function [Podospora anserina S mat+]
MSDVQPAFNTALRRVNATVLRVNHRRECIMGAKVLPNHVGTEGVTLQTWYSEHHRVNYISKDMLAALGWNYCTPDLGRTLNPRGGVFKPVGWVDLYVQQPTSPFDWKFVQFHVLDEPLGIEVYDILGQPRRFDLIIGEASCAQLLGNAFDYQQYNFDPEGFEQQRQYDYALWEQQQLEILNREQQDYGRYDWNWYVSLVLPLYHSFHTDINLFQIFSL